MTLDTPRFSLVAVALLAIGAGTITAQRASSPTPTPTQAPAAGWVARSNEHTRVVLEAQARLAPEGAAQVGVSGVDEQITDLSSGIRARIRESLTRCSRSSSAA